MKKLFSCEPKCERLWIADDDFFVSWTFCGHQLRWSYIRHLKKTLAAKNIARTVTKSMVICIAWIPCAPLPGWQPAAHPCIALGFWMLFIVQSATHFATACACFSCSSIIPADWPISVQMPLPMSLQQRPLPSNEESPSSQVFQWQHELSLHPASFLIMSSLWQ